MPGNTWAWLLFVYVLYFLLCKSPGLGGLGVVSMGQVEPQQVWHENCLGLFSFC